MLGGWGLCLPYAFENNFNVNLFFWHVTTSDIHAVKMLRPDKLIVRPDKKYRAQTKNIAPRQNILKNTQTNTNHRSMHCITYLFVYHIVFSD